MFQRVGHSFEKLREYEWVVLAVLWDEFDQTHKKLDVSFTLVDVVDPVLCF